MRITNIRPHHITSHLHGLRRAKKSARTCNLSLTCLRNILKSARIDGHLKTSPADGLEWFKTEKKAHRLYSPDEIDRLCQAALVERCGEQGARSRTAPGSAIICVSCNTVVPASRKPCAFAGVTWTWSAPLQNPALQQFYPELPTLFRKHYPKATPHLLKDKIYFEHDTRVFVVHETLKTGEGQDPWETREMQIKVYVQLAPHPSDQFSVHFAALFRVSPPPA